MSLVDELKRRKVFRVAIGYIVAAWVVAQVADLVADNFNAPDWVMQMIIALLVVGLPISLLLSWAFDMTADGLRRTETGGAQGSLVVSSNVIFAVVGVLFVTIAIVMFLTWPRGDPSIAVLPFEDISPSGDQAYLGNGIADELRHELQRLDGLRVAGRLTSIAYAQERSVAAADFNFGTILEGSVRKDGDRFRITVQLTNVKDGFAIWSQSFNRKLDQIFELEEEIATSVAGSLGVRLGVGGVNAFRGAGTRNVEAYEAYLKAISKSFLAEDTAEAITLLERAVELDPNYAAAWSMLGGRVLSTTYDVLPEEVPTVVERAHDLALRGAELNPESAIAHSVLAAIRMTQRNWVGSEQGHRRAIELRADRPAVEWYGRMLMRTGRTAAAREQFELAVELEPLGGRPVNGTWHTSLTEGRIAETKEIIANWQDALNATENRLDVAFNEQDPEALKAAIRALPDVKDDYLGLPYRHLYSVVLAEFDSPERVLSILDSVYRDENLQWQRKSHDIALLAAYFGDPEFALKVKGEEVLQSTTRLHAIWYPVMSDVRRLPGFKDLAKKLNLVEYWRTYSWPDHCEPVGDNDFMCP